MQKRIPFRKQLTGFSCSAAVFASAVKYLTGKSVSHARAIFLTKCMPDGADMIDIRRALRKFGLVAGNLKIGRKPIRKALAAGKIVIIDDNRTYESSHVMIIYRETKKFYLVMDPMEWKVRRRSASYVLRAAKEAFTVHKP